MHFGKLIMKMIKYGTLQKDIGIVILEAWSQLFPSMDQILA